MHDLTAQVTSSLLPFSGVTVDALGGDEITLDSVLHGKFTVGRSGLAWLACGPHLEVVHAVTGERLSAYCFSGGGEHPPNILAARDFSWLKRSGLLVGLEETEGSVLCLYDLGLSRVVKAVVIPGRITAIEPLVSYGGASTSTQHLHQSLRWFFGIAAVVTDLGHVLLVDLCLDDLSCSQSELDASDLQVVTKSPAEIPRLREVSTREGRHLCLQLNGPSGIGATALQYISRTNQLAVGFSDGYLQLWNMKTLKKEYHSQLEGGRVPVHAFTFQEPENDPRNCCYLWAVQSSQDLEGDMVSLRLLQLAFSERKCLASGKILYEGLEYCEERYSQDLSGTAFPLRAQATNTRLLSCQTIEKFRPHPDRDDSMNEVASPDTSVSMFSWQVKAYGQANLSTYIGVFDINRWYHAQMPDSLRTGESLQTCPYLAAWSLDPVVQMASPHIFLDVVVHERSLSRGLPFTCPPPEQYFNPTTYNFDATCLLNSGIVHLTCSGYQKETLGFLKKAAPCSSDIISTSYSHCLMSGLLSSRLGDTQASSLSQEEQLDAILSTAVETSSLGLITGCIKQWTAEEQPGSALNLRYILDWAWNKVVQTKEELDGICAPLFDSSSNFTDPQTMQLLQHTQRLLSNLSAIFHCLLSEAQELTQKGLVGLMNKNMVSSLISKYAQVVLWFCRTGLLPEGSDNDALQISRPFYTHSVISNYYTIRREELTRLAKGKWCADCLMIDGLVGQCGEHLTNLWKRDEGGTGHYPPPTLHALLDIYLLDNIDEAAKHAIVIYLLLDVMYSFPNKDGASVESFPTAFAIPIGLVKLVQGLWLLDHHDHQSSFELLLHPAASQFHFEWQHERVLQALMCQGQQSVALRYFHVTKPAISSTSQAKLCLSVLLHNRCLIEAWYLLRQHSNRLNMTELLGFLYENCQELGLIKELLKLPLGLNEQECLEKFLQGTGGLQNRELLMVHYLQQANYIPALQLNHSLKMNLVNERDPKLKERSNTRNSILDQYGKVLPRVQRKLAMERAKPYQHSNTIHREVSRPQPLSAITKRTASEKVMSRAGFINNVLTKIEEVWLGKGATQSSPAKSPRATEFPSSSPKSSCLALPEPFLGTPITLTSKRKSRLIDLVVHPTCQTPQPLLSPPRPPSAWVSPKTKAPELNLLQTPQVVKRARALAASGPVFSGFTPQSILRSSLRPTPIATPSASPGRSVTPPIRSKESRITFIEEAESPEVEKSIRWTNGMAADSEISRLTRSSSLSKAARKTWSSQPAEEEEDGDEEGEQPRIRFLPPVDGISSPQLRHSESESSSTHEVTAEKKQSDAMQARLSLSLDTSQTSVRSTDTTLEFFDAPLSVDHEGQDGHRATKKDDDDDDDVVTVNINYLAEKEDPESTTEAATSPITEQTLPLTSEDSEKEKDDVREDRTSEDGMEVDLELEAKTGVVEVDLEQEAKTGVVEVDLEQEAKTGVVEVDLEQEAKTGVVEVDLEQEAKTEEEAQSKKEDDQDIESSSKQDAAPVDQNESSTRHQVGNQEAESADSGTEAESRDLPVKAEGEDLQSEATELSEPPKPLGAAETISELADDLEQSEDLTEFVQRHLFGSDLSPPLTRSTIHNASQNQPSFNSEPLGKDEEEAQAATEAPLVFTTQKSAASVTSSEPTGTDSHSVVSVNDSEDLSSSGSEEEEEEEESDQEEEEEEEEDSGSEVEIIEEVPGNDRLPPLQSSSVFVQQGHTHFLPTQSEQEAAVFSLITPGAEIEMVGEDMEGEVVMVRLGADDGMMDPDEDVEQGSSYMELKPSTTLLVPVELVEGQHGLIDGTQLNLPELQQTVVADETHGSFSLMLDVEEDGDKEAGALPVENNLQSCDPSIQSQVVDASNEFLVHPEVILLSREDQDAPQSEEALQEDNGEESETVDGNAIDGPKESEVVKLQADLQTEYIEAEQEAEDAKEQKDVELVMLAEDHESVALSVSEPAPVGECLAAVDDLESVAKTEAADVGVEAKDKQTSAEEQEEPEENGPSAETEPAVEEEELQDRKASVEAEKDNSEDINTEMKQIGKGRPSRPGKQVLSSNSEPDEELVPEPPLSQRKRTPSIPTRRMTRGRMVTFVSPLSEEANEPEEDVKMEDTKTSTLVSTSPSRTPRKSKQVKETKVPASTPRRSTRKTQPDPPKEEDGEVEVMDNNTSIASTSKASSPARRSQRVTATRTSQMTRIGSEKVSTATEVEMKHEDKEEEVKDVKASQQTNSKTPTPSKHTASQIKTPRRSNRRVTSSAEVVETPLEILKEENEQDEVFDSPVRRSSRRTKTELSETLPSVLPSSARTSRHSSRISLNVFPQVKLVPVSLPRKMKEETTSENIAENEDLHKPEPARNASRTNSHHPTRSKLWDHPEEDLPLLDSPLEVNSETVADALIKRLQDEEEKQEDDAVVKKVVRTSKKSKKSSVEEVHSPVKDGLVPDPDDDDPSPGEHSFIYSPSRRQTRAQRTDPSEHREAPITRSRVKAQDEISSEDNVEVNKDTGTSKTRKTSKRTAKSKAVLKPLPIAEVKLISPLPSPADPIPRASKRIKEGEAPTTSRNLRRKRVLDTVLTKPVTRRKKL